MQRKVVLVCGFILAVFCAAGVYLWVSNLMLKASLNKDLEAKTLRQGVDLKKHKKMKDDLRKRMEEKYRADMVSYQAAKIRLEREKSKQLQKTGGVK